MRFKVLFYRFLFAIAGFLLPLVFLAGAAPYVINAEPVKKRLVEELRSWTGSYVELRGPVTIESFFSLSLNAQDIEFYAFKGLPQLKTLKAEEIVARIAWMDLFAGRLDFDKIKINGAQIDIRAFGREDGLVAAETFLAMSRDAQFDAFVIRDCVISIKGASEKAASKEYSLNNLLIALDPSSQDVELEATFLEDAERTSVRARIRAGALREPGAVLPLELGLDTPYVSASFEGTANVGDNWRALGNVSVALQNPSRLGKWLDQPYFDNLHLPVSVSGKAEITKNRVAFEEARLSIAEQNATGEFDLVFGGANPQLLGSVAFGSFDVAAFTQAVSPGKQISAVDFNNLKNVLIGTRLDLRLSAESIKFKDIETGETAFTLLGENGRFSTEIAHMDILGGGVFGHAELDTTGDEPLVKTRLTSENLDIYQVQSIADIPPWLSGNIGGNIEASTSGLGLSDILGNAAISGKTSISDGGQIRLDLDKLASIQKVRSSADGTE